MSSCECLAGCPFFNDQMGNYFGMALIYKKRYCSSESADWSRCARYQVFKALGRGSVPSDLFPNQVDRVEGILQAAAPAS